ncbi:MAG: PAS domain S-box protein, partial [Methylobacter sp.]
GFIVACGTTHLLSVITIWIPLYWLDGLIKGFTAIISIATAVLMLWVIPRALSVPSAAQLRAEIQQRKAAEESLRHVNAALQKNIAQTQLLLDSALDGIISMDHNGNIIGWNSQAEHVFGYSSEQVLGREMAELIVPPAYREKHRQGVSHFMTPDASCIVGKRLEITGLRADASEFPIELTVGALEQEGGCFFSAFVRDISERKQMEQKLRDSDAFNVSILNSLTSHIAVLDAQGVIIAINKAWQQFAKENGAPESSQDMLRVNYIDVCKNASNQPYCDEANSAIAGIAAVLAGERESFRLEYPCHSPTQQRWFQMTVVPLQGSRRGVVIQHLNITERKQAEGVLNQLKAMIDISLDGFWIIDLNGKLVQVNEAYAKMSGYSRDELVNMNISQLEVLEDPEQIQAHIAKVVVQGYDLFETRHRHKDGHAIDIEISVAFLPEFQQFCVFCRDITKRKLMEYELKASEAKFRSIIEVSPVPMALSDEQLNITFLNPAFVQTFGYSLEDVPTLADWYLKAYPDPDYRHWVEADCPLTQEKAQQEQPDFAPLEVDIYCKNNRIKTVLVTTAGIYHDLANGHLTILYDITQRKQMEAKLNSIFNASVEGMITIDMSNIIVSANAAVETIFGYKREELIGCSINKLMPSSQRAMDICNLPGSGKSAGQIQEIEGIHKNGSVVPLDLSIAEYSIDDAHFYTNIVRDVSLRKHREQLDKEHLDELAHATRLGLMGEMASGIAHEVNQPLSAISSYTQVSLNLINTESPDLVKITEILYKTQQQALRAGRIIHRMREFIKSHSKHYSIADINTLIHDAVSLCIAELKQNNIRLTFELEQNLPPIYVDHIQIEQVIINLIRNSIEALQDLPAKLQRQIIIHSCVTANNSIQVRVKDNGLGLNKDQQQKIFMPFYTTKTDGMGMGLSISRSLIEAHAGTLNFSSQPEKETTFYFTLPIQGT